MSLCGLVVVGTIGKERKVCPLIHIFFHARDLTKKKPGFFSDGSVTSQSVAIVSIRGLLVDLNQILQSYIIKIM